MYVDLGHWLYIDDCDVDMNGVLRVLIKPFGLIKYDIWGDLWDGDVKRELGLYIYVCCDSVYAHLELFS